MFLPISIKKFILITNLIFFNCKTISFSGKEGKNEERIELSKLEMEKIKLRLLETRKLWS